METIVRKGRVPRDRTLDQHCGGGEGELFEDVDVNVCHAVEVTQQTR